MLNGLKKGTQTAKERAKDNFVDYVCPVCNIAYKMKQWEVNGRKACSLKCAAKLNYEANTKHLRKLSEINHQKKLQEKNKIKQFVIEWTYNNKEIILNCPLNKITTHLQPLLTAIEENYHIKDMRSVMLCFDITSRKEFVLHLQNIIKD